MKHKQNIGGIKNGKWRREEKGSVKNVEMDNNGRTHFDFANLVNYTGKLIFLFLLFDFLDIIFTSIGLWGNNYNHYNPIAVNIFFKVGLFFDNNFSIDYKIAGLIAFILYRVISLFLILLSLKLLLKIGTQLQKKVLAKSFTYSAVYIYTCTMLYDFHLFGWIDLLEIIPYPILKLHNSILSFMFL